MCGDMGRLWEVLSHLPVDDNLERLIHLHVAHVLGAMAHIRLAVPEGVVGRLRRLARGGRVDCHVPQPEGDDVLLRACGVGVGGEWAQGGGPGGRSRGEVQGGGRGAAARVDEGTCSMCTEFETEPHGVIRRGEPHGVIRRGEPHGVIRRGERTKKCDP